jgi:hypothetical protein
MLILIGAFSAHVHQKQAICPRELADSAQSIGTTAHAEQILPIGLHMAHLPMRRPSIILAKVKFNEQAIRGYRSV